MRPESQWAWEVQLTLHIVHRDGYLGPVDECEKRCAEEIQRNLKRLGVQPKSWSESRTHDSGGRQTLALVGGASGGQVQSNEGE